MKKGANLWCFPEGRSPEQAIDLAVRCGFDEVEFNVEEKGSFSMESTAKDVERIRSYAVQAGITLGSVSTALLWTYSLTSPDAALRSRGKQVVEKMIDVASVIGAQTVLVVPGLVSADVAYDQAYARSQETLAELAQYAAQRGVDIGVENVWNKFLLSPLEMKRFIEEIGHPSLGAYFDVGNVLVNGYPEQWIRILGEHIKRVHVKDFRTEIGNIQGFVPLLQGDVSWRKVIQSLSEVGYKGCLTAEIPPYRSHAEQSLADISSALDLIIREE